MKITRGTTPTLTLNVTSDLDLHEISVIWAYITQKKHVVIDKSITDVEFDYDNRVISMKLSQEDTLALKPDVEAIFQVRLKMNDGTALASGDYRVTIKDVGKDGVISE